MAWTKIVTKVQIPISVSISSYIYIYTLLLGHCLKLSYDAGDVVFSYPSTLKEQRDRKTFFSLALLFIFMFVCVCSCLCVRVHGFMTTTTDNISLVLKTEGKFATSTTDSFLVPAATDCNYARAPGG